MQINGLDRDTTNTCLLSALASLAEDAPGGEAPESYVYLPLNATLGVHLDQFRSLVGFMAKAGWIVRDDSGPTIRITDEGRTVVADCRRIIAEAKAARGAVR